jgi:hypothetical protein
MPRACRERPTRSPLGVCRRRRPRVSPGILTVIVGLAALPCAHRPAWATGRDFVDETMVAEGMRARETGLEVGTDARIDKADAMQGWFGIAAEYGLTSRWLMEAVGLGLARGQGPELAGWRAETRYVLLEGDRAPVAAAAALEWEVETSAAKHLLYERVLIPRLVLSRTFGGSLLATANGGLAWQLDPVRRSAFAWAAGARWPDRGPVTAGLEITREPLDDATRLVPQLALDFGEARLRMGGAFGLKGAYRFIARVVLEKELDF